MPNVLWLLIVVIIAVALLPTWPYATRFGYSHYGYYPSGVLLVIFVILILLLATGRL